MILLISFKMFVHKNASFGTHHSESQTRQSLLILKNYILSKISQQ